MKRIFVILLAYFPLLGFADPSFLKGIFEGSFSHETRWKQQDQEQLSIYRRFILEGRKLDLFCQEKQRVIEYPNKSQADQGLKSTMATAQLIGLEILAKAIPKYAEYFKFSQSEYTNLVENLIGNYCSRNITAISSRGLNKMMQDHFKNNDFELPKTHYFSLIVGDSKGTEKARKNEFRYTLELFKSLCSWGGEVNDAKAMTPLLQNPVWMSFIGRQMSSQSLFWDNDKGQVLVKKNKKLNRVFCNGIFCRRINRGEVTKSFYPSIGFVSIQDDIHRLYCTKLKLFDLSEYHPNLKIRKIINEWTADDVNILNIQMISLLTGVSDTFMHSKAFYSVKMYTKKIMEHYLNRWVRFQEYHFDKHVAFEESLKIELVHRDLHFKEEMRNFGVEFNISMGELDRVYQRIGKVSINFDLRMTKKAAQYFGRTWPDIMYEESEESNIVRERIIGRLKKHLSFGMEELDKISFLKPWEKFIKESIIKELLLQFTLSENSFPLETSPQGHLSIPIKFHVSLFAMKHFRDRIMIQRKKRFLH